MPAARDDFNSDSDLELTPMQRLQAVAAMLAIGLQRLRQRSQTPPDSQNSRPFGLQRILRIPHE